MEVAHGVGGGQDLPIPASFAIAGGGAALVISFAVLLLAWRRPRFTDPASGLRALPSLTRIVDHTAFRSTLKGFGLLLFGFTAMAAIFGRTTPINPTAGIVYVWLWVGIVPFSLAFGPFFRAVSPVRTIYDIWARMLHIEPTFGARAYPAWAGLWPAAAALFAFVWMELVYPDGDTMPIVRLWFTIYLALMLVGCALFGETWLRRADPFEVYSNLVARLSIWTRTPDGQLALTNPLRNLTSVPARTGLVAVVAVLLGSTAFDSFSSSARWIRYVQSSDISGIRLETALLLGVCVVVGVVFTVSMTALAGQSPGSPRWQITRALAPSIVPIIVGYMFAHYLTLLVEAGQQTLIYANDPLSRGENWFGLANYDVNYWLSNQPALLATTKVLVIVAGHILGAISAHDRALQLLPASRHVVGQLPLLAVMTAYTWGGLYLLFGA